MTQTASPSSRLVGLAFVAGLVLGGALVAPALPETLSALPAPSQLSASGRVLVAGVLGMVAVVLVLALVYFLFLFVDQ